MLNPNFSNYLKYGTRHIISCLREKGSEVSCMLLCGGLVQSDLFVSTMADAVQIPIVIPEQKESVLLGSAMLGASASKYFTSLQAAMESMGGYGSSRLPNTQENEYEISFFFFYKSHELNIAFVLVLDIMTGNTKSFWRWFNIRGNMKWLWMISEHLSYSSITKSLSLLDENVFISVIENRRDGHTQNFRIVIVQ